MSKMRYLGNKTRMIDNIDLFISNLGITGKTLTEISHGQEKNRKRNERVRIKDSLSLQ